MEDIQPSSPQQNIFSRLTFRNVKRSMRRSLWLPFALVGLVVLIAGILAFRTLSNTSVGAQDGINLSQAKPLATQALNRTFEFPLVDGEGKEVSKIKYIIEGAELQDEIIVKGQRAYAVEGRTFLILNIKIINNYDQGIQINAKDYIRLIINGTSDRVAADVHNDPIQIQAISTKQTRLGFPIDDTYKSLVLQIGEIKGEKQTLNLDLK